MSKQGTESSLVSQHQQTPLNARLHLRLQHAQAAGESAEEELAALLEESGASMHTQKESRAEKAAWWRTRIALDARLQHLCADLQKRLGPWL